MKPAIIIILIFSFIINYNYAQESRESSKNDKKKEMMERKKRVKDARQRTKPVKKAGFQSFDDAIKDASTIKRLILRRKEIKEIPQSISKYTTGDKSPLLHKSTTN